MTRGLRSASLPGGCSVLTRKPNCVEEPWLLLRVLGRYSVFIRVTAVILGLFVSSCSTQESNRAQPAEQTDQSSSDQNVAVSADPISRIRRLYGFQTDNDLTAEERSAVERVRRTLQTGDGGAAQLAATTAPEARRRAEASIASRGAERDLGHFQVRCRRR